MTANAIGLNVLEPSLANYNICDTIPLNGQFSKESCCTAKTITYRLDGGTSQIISSIDIGSIGYYTNTSFTGNVLGVGNHTIAVSMTDSCLDTTSSTVSFNVLISNPLASIDSLSGSYISCGTMPLYGAFTKDSCCVGTVNYTVDGGALTPVTSYYTLNQVNGLWTGNILSGLSTGNHTVVLTINDTCTGSSSVTQVFSVFGANVSLGIVHQLTVMQSVIQYLLQELI